jgi:hypothetical protein
MSLLKNLLAGTASALIRRAVDRGIRSLERNYLDRDVPREKIPAYEKDAIVVMGSRIDHIPDADERDAIAHGVHIAGEALASTVSLELRQRFLASSERTLARSVLSSAAVYVLLEEVIEPALGASHDEDGRARRFAAHLASRLTQRAVLRLLA